MAGCIVSNRCPYCKGLLQKGDALWLDRVDMTGWPDVPPVSVYAHRACWEKRSSEPSTNAFGTNARMPERTPELVQGVLFPAANNALAIGGAS